MFSDPVAAAAQLPPIQQHAVGPLNQSLLAQRLRLQGSKLPQSIIAALLAGGHHQQPVLPSPSPTLGHDVIGGPAPDYGDSLPGVGIGGVLGGGDEPATEMTGPPDIESLIRGLIQRGHGGGQLPQIPTQAPLYQMPSHDDTNLEFLGKVARGRHIANAMKHLRKLRPIHGS